MLACHLACESAYRHITDADELGRAGRSGSHSAARLARNGIQGTSHLQTAGSCRSATL